MPQPAVYVFEVKLKGAAIPVWRILEVNRTTTLHEFHLCIQVAMGWKVCHLYLFRVKELNYGMPEDPEEGGGDGMRDSRKVKLKDLELKPGDSFEYIYDFGDYWQHEVIFRGVLREASSLAGLPACTAGAMACPFEDMGGIFAYNDFIERHLKGKFKSGPQEYFNHDPYKVRFESGVGDLSFKSRVKYYLRRS